MSIAYSSARYDAAKQRLQQLQSRRQTPANKITITGAVSSADNTKAADTEHKENNEPTVPTITAQLQQSLQQCDAQYALLQSTVSEMLAKYGLAYTADAKLQPVYNKFKTLYTSSFNTLNDINTTAHVELAVQQSQCNAVRLEYENKLKQQHLQHTQALKRVEATVERKYSEKMAALQNASKRAADMREHLKRELRVEVEATMHSEYNQSITAKINELRESAGSMLQAKQAEITQLTAELTQSRNIVQSLQQQYSELQQLYDRMVKQAQIDAKLIAQQADYIRSADTQSTALQQQVAELQQSHSQQCHALTATVTQLQQKLSDSEQQHSSELAAINSKVQAVLQKKNAQIAGVQQQLQQATEASTALQAELEATKHELNNML